MGSICCPLLPARRSSAFAAWRRRVGCFSSSTFDPTAAGHFFFNATRCRESALGSNFLINAGKRLAAPAFAEDTASKHRREPMMPTITPFLWFDTQAEEAMTSKRVMNAMLQMDKLDLNRLEQAYNGE
jgi:hypothetical protein